MERKKFEREKKKVTKLFDKESFAIECEKCGGHAFYIVMETLSEKRNRILKIECVNCSLVTPFSLELRDP